MSTIGFPSDRFLRACTTGTVEMNTPEYMGYAVNIFVSALRRDTIFNSLILRGILSL